MDTVSVTRLSRRYQYRIFPSEKAQREFAQVFGCIRYVYNQYIALNIARRESGEKFLSPNSAMNTITTEAKKKPETEWLSVPPAATLQQSVRNAGKAFTNFFDSHTGKRKGRKVGFPKFKSRHRGAQTATFTRDAFRINRKPSTEKYAGWKNTHKGGGRLVLLKLGSFHIHWSRPLPGPPSSVTIIKRPDNTWWASFVVEFDAPVVPEAPARDAGIDLGMTDFAAIVYSDGTREKVGAGRHFKKKQRKLRITQKALSRRQNGSKRREKARLRVAKVHAEVAGTRKDFHLKLVTRLTRENQAVTVEDLTVAGLARTMGKNAQGRGFRRSVHDAGWGQFISILDYKAKERGVTFSKVNPKHTSQICSMCGVLDGPKPLSVRVWKCRHCGAELDRDYNAAVNILVAGYATVAGGSLETQNVRGDGVSPRSILLESGVALSVKREPDQGRGLEPRSEVTRVLTRV